MELQAQLELYQAELASEKQRGALANAGKIADLEQQIADLQQKINQQPAAVKPKPTDGAKKYDFTSDFDDVFGVTFLNDTIQSIIDSVKAEISGQYQSQIDALRAQLKQATDERDDFERKLKNATAQLDEANKEVARLKEREFDLQKQLAEAPLPPNRIDITPVNTNLDTNALKKKLADELAKKPKIYNVRPGDHNTTYYIAEDEQGNEIKIPYLELGKYQVLQFREQTNAQVDSQPTQNVTEQQFPTITPPEVPSVSNGLDQSAQGPAGESDAPVTRAEFEALKADVEVLKRRAGMVA